VAEYDDALEIHIRNATPGTTPPTTYMPRTITAPEEIFGSCWALLDQYTTGDVRRVTEKLLTEHQAAFMACPGGKRWHHDRIGGLVEHTLEVTQLALFAVSAVPRLAPVVSLSVLVGAALIHDVGKIEAYEWEHGTFAYRSENYPFGHLVSSHRMFLRAAESVAGTTNLSSELRHVEHIILSHHGQGDFGSPVEPATIEALLVHRADYLSANLDVGLSVLGKMNGEDLSMRDTRVWNSLGMLYRFR
jgi:3'-5' exoribonuclease